MKYLWQKLTAVAMGGAAVMLVWALFNAALLRHAHIVGGSAAARAEAERMFMQLRGHNLITLDLSEWRAKLETLPSVAEARLRRRLPDTLEAELIDRRPLAVWGAGGLVDTAGLRYAGTPSQALPIFRGPAGRSVSMSDFYGAAAELLAPLNEEIAQLQVDENGEWRVFLRDGLILYLGRDNRRDRLQRYARHAGELRRQFAGMQAVDLRYERGFAVVTREDGV